MRERGNRREDGGGERAWEREEDGSGEGDGEGREEAGGKGGYGSD